MFYISKIFWALAEPTTLLVALLAVGAGLLFTRFSRTGRWLVAGAAALGVIGGFSPLSTWLILPLEDRFPRADLSGRPVDGIVILGGAEDARVATARDAHALNMSAERMTEAVALARRFPDARVVFTGGSIEILRAPAFGADAARRMLSDLGVDGPRVLFDRQARNTAENALYARRLADPKPGERWLLVTSGWHMPRAMGLFRKAGFDVEAWPTDYRTIGPGAAWAPFASPGDGLMRLDFVSKEWLGLLFNWLSGRSDALLPGP